MITVLHPILLPIIQQMPIGVLPIVLEEEEFPILVVKAPKEYILAGKINASFKIYLAPVFIENNHTIGAISAFFDDEDEPLIITTPLFSDKDSAMFIEVLRSKKITVYFFDELSRERLAYHASVSVPDATKARIDNLSFLRSSFSKVRLMLDASVHWFEMRTPEDDSEAIHISLENSIFGKDIFIQDLRPENHSFHGSRGFSHTILEREESGNYQEEDIVQCLISVFPGEQIFINPKRTYDMKEMCDILVVTDARVLIVQAKDSPNIDRISRQKLSRKRSNVLNALRKAVKQIKGAVGYYHRQNDVLEFYIEGKLYSIKTTGLELKALIVVKELFNDQYEEYSSLLLKLVEDKSVQCIALDYPELYQYCVQFKGEESFFKAYTRVMKHAMSHGEYPRLRFDPANQD